MSVGDDGYGRDTGYPPVATLMRWVSVRLIDVSRGGCRLDCTKRIESGTSGLLVVELAGLKRIDHVRVARCQQRMGAGVVYDIGAELLRIRRMGRRTVRMAVEEFISGGRGVGNARGVVEGPPPRETRANKASKQSENRAPPARPERGS